MSKKVLIIIGIVIGLLSVVLLMLPRILNLLGLHPYYNSEKYNLEGEKALIITTSNDSLGVDGKKTGVYASEMTIPYYEFLDANMTVDVASIKGGKIPVEPMSIKWPLKTSADKRFLKDTDYLNKTKNSLKIDDVDFTKYDIIYMAGGWGAAYDLGQSEVLGEKISKAYAEGKILGSVCHGALGFIKAIDEKGEVLVKGKAMTAVTDKQVKELGITITPLHPETELRRMGANFESETAFKDFFANHIVVEGNIVTGQNQNSGGETAQEMMKILDQKSK